MIIDEPIDPLLINENLLIVYLLSFDEPQWLPIFNKKISQIMKKQTQRYNYMIMQSKEYDPLNVSLTLPIKALEYHR